MRRTLVALSLTATLVTAPSGVLDRLWTLLSAIWSDPPVYQPQTKNGCTGDPNGQCKPSPPPPQTKEGCGADPSGLCKPGS